ncbi:MULTISPECIES: nucleotide exchange factor GrpE [Rhizobium/Agrobacterium group]|jgi:molecular chaperone GrpE|uniref:Protein GrpE n=2 Tax=Rhizobium/Agrobacterium group TaxID=227290 RepID=A0A1B9TP38_AGRTU|nr:MULTISPECIES: nucleotide exchange factor GrpE [Rhizobium/Agrobacterium group]AHK00226.1 heat shock protein GrpE [Agrobacterium tumefaciens LBA4213 (Ach5)]AKC06087.1 GRPE protein [Agrobacterium tumefaciens]EHJ98168.1 heat shock protein GrpE [Agrobacterium tumefaciens 5A]MDP9559913.1 molecular chaperone GrpE [Rhizobium nepotum]QDG92082.1 nucleotide exchange factor GrpE [Rhizobium sp. NIBRBAC000502774]HCV72939.1 nucleotide exchange factor GrpE [Agrobacterium sp.]
MTDDTKKPGPDADVAEEFVEPAFTGEETAEAAEPDPIELLRAENADLRDKFLRLAAEMDNLRRRTEREVKDAKAYSLAAFARDMLAVSDNLRRALEAIPDELKTNGEAGLNGLIEGVEMTERSMLSTLERHGVKKIDAEGQKFDPNFHQAMFEIPNTAVPNNTVLQVVQAGFTIGDRVLRPAMVGVSKGGPKVETAAAPEPGTASVNEKDA